MMFCKSKSQDEATRTEENLGENTETVVSLLVPCCSNVGDVARHFCGEDSTEGVPIRGVLMVNRDHS